LLTDRSADNGADAVVDAVALSFVEFESAVAVVTVAVLLIVPVVPAPTFTTSVNTSFALAATDGLVQLTVPLVPTAGVVQLQPAAEVNDAKVVPPGSVSSSVDVVAGSGPALATVIV
jgi:hypothetical protein